MAIVLLNRLWLHDAANLADNVAIRVQQIDEEKSVDGDVRKYAGGRLRSVSSAGTRRTVEVELRLIERADVDTVKGWVGRKLMLRDPRGRKIFGVFHEVEVEEWPARDRATVTFTFEELSHSEAV